MSLYKAIISLIPPPLIFHLIIFLKPLVMPNLTCDDGISLLARVQLKTHNVTLWKSRTGLLIILAINTFQQSGSYDLFLIDFSPAKFIKDVSQLNLGVTCELR